MGPEDPKHSYVVLAPLMRSIPIPTLGQREPSTVEGMPVQISEPSWLFA